MARVKRYESGVLRDPITITPDHTGARGDRAVRAARHLGLPGARQRQEVVGIVTNRDLRFETRCDAPVREIMTPRERLITVREGATLDEGKALMHKHKLERVLVVNDAFELRGPDDREGHHQADQLPRTPRATRSGQLRVGAAVGVGEGTEERVELLVKAGVDAIVVDTAHGHSAGVIERVRWVKQQLSAGRRDRRQHRHRRGGAGAGRSGRRRGQGRHRPGLDLHHAHRRRRRRAADHGDRQRGHGAARAAACR